MDLIGFAGKNENRQQPIYLSILKRDQTLYRENRLPAIRGIKRIPPKLVAKQEVRRNWSYRVLSWQTMKQVGKEAYEI